VHRLRLKGAYEDLDLVFATETGGPLDGQNLAYRTLKPILKAAGLPSRFRWYDCRHTCATLLLAAGENPKVVSERLGHATVAFTLDRYAHVLPGMQEQASGKLEAILFGG
jgi:integrase